MYKSFNGIPCAFQRLDDEKKLSASRTNGVTHFHINICQSVFGSCSDGALLRRRDHVNNFVIFQDRIFYKWVIFVLNTHELLKQSCDKVMTASHHKAGCVNIVIECWNPFLST